MEKKRLYFIIISIVTLELLYLSINNHSLRGKNEYYMELLSRSISTNQDYFPNLNLYRVNDEIVDRLYRYGDKRDILLFINQVPEEISDNLFNGELDRLLHLCRILMLYEVPRYEKYIPLPDNNRIKDIPCYRIKSSEFVTVPKTGIYYLSSEGKVLFYLIGIDLKWLRNLIDNSSKSP